MGQIMVVIGGMGLGGYFIHFGIGWIRHGVPVNQTKTIHGNAAKAAGGGLIGFGVLMIAASIAFSLLAALTPTTRRAKFDFSADFSGPNVTLSNAAPAASRPLPLPVWPGEGWGEGFSQARLPRQAGKVAHGDPASVSIRVGRFLRRKPWPYPSTGHTGRGDHAPSFGRAVRRP